MVPEQDLMWRKATENPGLYPHVASEESLVLNPVFFSIWWIGFLEIMGSV